MPLHKKPHAYPCQRSLGGVRGRHESDEVARKRGLLDIAIISTMRDALLRRTEAAKLRWKDIQFCEDGTGRLTIRLPQIAQGFVTFLGPQAVKDLLAIRPEDVDPESSVFNLTGRSISRRIRTAAKAAGQGDGFSGPSCRVGMARDLARTGATVPEIMLVGRWKSAGMMNRLIRAKGAASGPVAKHYERQKDE